jgi:hypothetical protein
MASARGDRKPCTHAECSGTMQFGRERLPQTSSAMTVDGERGWVCSETPGHFQLASDRPRLEATVNSAPQAGWDDDGGPTFGPHNIDSRV